jgi:hypothetical protein
MCWTAVNGGAGPLDYWNRDGHGITPEDYELFAFVGVNNAQRIVKVYNYTYDVRLARCGQHLDPKWRFYIGLSGDTFNCNETGTNACQFVVDFV